MYVKVFYLVWSNSSLKIIESWQSMVHVFVWKTFTRNGPRRRDFVFVFRFNCNEIPYYGQVHSFNAMQCNIMQSCKWMFRSFWFMDPPIRRRGGISWTNALVSLFGSHKGRKSNQNLNKSIPPRSFRPLRHRWHIFSINLHYFYIPMHELAFSQWESFIILKSNFNFSIKEIWIYCLAN